MVNRGNPFRSVDELVHPAVSGAIGSMHLAPEHAGAAALALDLARSIDALAGPCEECGARGTETAGLARELTKLLHELGATPAGAAALAKGAGSAAPLGALHAMRGGRAG